MKDSYVLLTKWLSIREVSERGQHEKETQQWIFLGSPKSARVGRIENTSRVPFKPSQLKR